MKKDEMDDDQKWQPTLEDIVPTIDTGPLECATYRDWLPETTKVVSGPLGPKGNYPGMRFKTLPEAKAYWLARAGRIFEEHYVPYRYFFRVRRDA